MSTKERREKEKQSRRQEILVAAQALFARQGYHLANMDAIAREANLAKGTIYLYFKTKEELFFSLMDERSTEMFSTIDTLFRKKMTGPEKLRQFISTQLNFCDQNRDFFRIFISAQFDLDPHEKAKMGQKHLTQIKDFTAKVGKIVAECGPGLVSRDPAFLASLLMGLIQATVLKWLIGGQTDKIEKKSELLCQIFLHGICKLQ